MYALVVWMPWSQVFELVFALAADRHSARAVMLEHFNTQANEPVHRTTERRADTWRTRQIDTEAQYPRARRPGRQITSSKGPSLRTWVS